MQAQRVKVGETTEYTPSGAVAAGEVVIQNGLVGIAPAPIAANELGSLDVEGIFKMVKATGAINAGAAVYWDADGNPVSGTAGTGACTTTSSANTYLGKAELAAGSSDETVMVRLEPTAAPSVTIHQDLTNEITDPGDAGAIPVTASGSCAMTTAGTETRTLARPTNVGDMLSLFIDTDGGQATITVTGGVNQTGNNTIVMAQAGDHIVLVGISVGGTKRWSVVSNDGCALSTV